MKLPSRVIDRAGVLLSVPGTVLLALFCHLRARAEVQPEVSVKAIYYPIQGDTSAGWRREIARLGPIDPKTGRRFDAYTSWRVSWRYWTSRRGDRCDLTRLEVTTEVTITLPRWMPPSTAPPSPIRAWDQYWSALLLHEDGHKQHGIQAGREIGRLAPGNFSRSNRDETGQLFDRAARAIPEAYSRADGNYDRLTRHGITQGVVLPRPRDPGSLALITVRIRYDRDTRARGPVFMAVKKEFSSFQDLLDNTAIPVLVDFYATWCGPCQMMAPILEQAGIYLKDRLQIVKIDTDKYPNIASRYQIQALPTLVLFKNGQAVDRIEGVWQADRLIQHLQGLL